MNSSKAVKEFTGCLGTWVIAMGMLVLSSTLSGFVFSRMWGWFIVDLFAAPPLGIAQAIGLAMTVQLVTVFGKNKTSDEDLLADVIKVFMRPLIYLAMGWVVTWFL